MAQILIRAKNNTHSDPTKDRWSYKTGMPVVIQDDDHIWGSKEGLPDFVVIKFPLVPKSRLEKYITPEEVQNGFEDDLVTLKYDIYRRRLWKLRLDDIPLGERKKLQTDGELIIKATPEYNGKYDYTWDQIRTYFRNLNTNLDESGELK